MFFLAEFILAWLAALLMMSSSFLLSADSSARRSARAFALCLAMFSEFVGDSVLYAYAALT